MRALGVEAVADAADWRELPEAFEDDGVRPEEGSPHPTDEEAGVVARNTATPEQQPAAKARPLVLADLRDEQRTRVRDLIRGRLTAGTPTPAQPTPRDFIEEQAGLRLHGASVRVLLDSVRTEVASAMENNNGRANVVTADEAVVTAAPGALGDLHPAPEIAEMVLTSERFSRYGTGERWELPGVPWIGFDDVGFERWLMLGSTSRGARLRLDVEVPLILGGKLAYAIARVVDTNGGILPPAADGNVA